MTGRLLRAGAGVLAVVLVAGLAAGGWLLHRRDRQDDAARASLAAARRMVPELLTYDYRSLERDLGRAQADLTGDFRQQYASVIDTSVRPVAVKQKQSISARVVDAGVVSSSGSSTTVLVYLDQLASSTAKENAVSASRLEVVMRRTGDGWRIADLKAV